MTSAERKQQSEKILKLLNIPFIDHLPLIEEESETRIRTPQEIAERILILTYINVISEDEEAKEHILFFLKKENLWDSVSDNEKNLLQNKHLTDKDKINLSWRSEAIWLLLWTIKKVDKLELPQQQVPVSSILELLPKFLTSTKDFIKAAVIRSIPEILDMSDLIFRFHWAAKHTELNNLKTVELDSSIIYERHYAINWVTFYDENWDEITTDT